MTEQKNNPPPPTRSPLKDATARAAALRENLRRRKNAPDAQAVRAAQNGAPARTDAQQSAAPAQNQAPEDDEATWTR